MKTKIKEVQNYFKSAILEGRYEVKDANTRYITVLIDGEYEFKLWLANEEWGFSFYDAPFMSFKFTDEEKAIAYPKAMGFVSPIMIKRWELEVQMAELENQIKAL